MNAWQLPNEEELAAMEAAKPVKIDDLAEGKFAGMIEEVQVFTDDNNNQKQDSIGLVIRIARTPNEEHIGKLMQCYLNIKTKRGYINLQSYNFLCAMQPQIKESGKFDPTELTLCEFEADVVYNGRYWNFENARLIKKHEDFSF